MAAPKLKAGIVEEKLRELSGNLAAVGRALGVTRQAVSAFVIKHPSLVKVAEECRETFVDNVESALYREALNGNVTAQIFILKTQGKGRGYVERQELEHSGEITAKVVRIPIKQSKEEWEQQQSNNE